MYSNVFSQQHRAILSSDGFELLSKIPAILDDHSLTDALSIILSEVCKFQGWPVGHIYEVDKGGKRLNPTEIWYFKETNKKAQAFENITMATTFKLGQGLPGRVWKDNKPCWVEDVTVDQIFREQNTQRTLVFVVD